MPGPPNEPDRRSLLEELDRYTPADERECAMAARLRMFVAKYETCFDRTLLVGHVTGSAWIVDRGLDAAVLVHHRKLDKWLQPGGHADGDADVRRVALREATEETGLAGLANASPGIYDIDVHTIPARAGEPQHEHFDLRFAFFADRASEPIVSDESHAVRWIGFDEIERYAIDDSVRRLVRKTGVLRLRSARGAELRSE